MASLYRRPRSPFWWIAYIDPKDQKRKCESTGLRWSDEKQTAQADLIKAKFEIGEKEIAIREINKSDWHWVDSFLEKHYEDPLSFKRATAAWHHVHHWCLLKRINPIDVRYKHANEYLIWRLKKDKKGKKVAHNTALLEIKVWGRIMQEAVRFELIVGNPLVRLGLKRRGTKVKPIFTEEHIELIWRELQTRPEWMRIAFEIALQTGCRFSETRLPMKDVDLKRNAITFRKPKGGEDRAFSIPIPKPLLSLLTRLKKEEREYAWTVDFEHGTNASRAFSRFFKQLGLQQKGYSFHCTRVTKVTRLFEEGVPREVAMKLVNHASETVHEIYVRATDHLQQWANAGTQPQLKVDLPSSDATVQNLPKK